MKVLISYCKHSFEHISKKNLNVTTKGKSISNCVCYDRSRLKGKKQPILFTLDRVKLPGFSFFYELEKIPSQRQKSFP